MARPEPAAGADLSFDDRLELVRSATEELERCLRLDDHPQAAVAAARLRRALERAERSAIAIGVAQSEFHIETTAALKLVQETAYALLARAPIPLEGVISIQRFLARFNVAPLDRYRRSTDGLVDASHATLAGVSLGELDLVRARLVHATLRDVHAVRARLDLADAEGARLLRVDARELSARLARFDRSCIEDTRFDRAQLARSTWEGARVVGTSFREASLVDFVGPGASFIDCDFRGADLRESQPGERAGVPARLIRCNLQGAQIDALALRDIVLIECDV